MDSENLKGNTSNEAQSDSLLEPEIVCKKEGNLQAQSFGIRHRNELHHHLSENELYYDLSGKISVTLFVHKSYEKKYKERIGADQDLIKLKTFFQNVLKADFDYIWDATKTQIYEKLDSVANLDPDEYSCIIIIVITHGTSEKLAASDEEYDRSILWEKLEGKFVGKPKLYFIQSCRGKEEDEGMEVADSIGEMPDDEEVTITLPKMADFLQMHSTFDGYKAFTVKSGSYFIQTICQVFTEMYDKWDLLQMLTLVNKMVANKEIKYQSKIVKEIPQIVSTLRKFLKFKTQES